MCWGAFDAATKHRANAICFQGNSLDTPIGFNAQANLLYDLDGLVGAVHRRTGNRALLPAICATTNREHLSADGRRTVRRGG